MLDLTDGTWGINVESGLTIVIELYEMDDGDRERIQFVMFLADVHSGTFPLSDIPEEGHWKISLQAPVCTNHDDYYLF